GAQAICKKEGKVCGADAPCCFNGACGSDVKSCSEGCDPSNSFAANSCYPLPKCANYKGTLASPSLIQPRSAYNGDPNSVDWLIEYSPNHATIKDNQIVMEMREGDSPNEFGRKEGVGTTISWTRHMQYGKMTARIKTGVLSPGVVSSFITMSPEGDEIDFEWVGKDRKQVQSNYYYNGILDYTKGGMHALDFDTTADFHEYSIDWQPDYISWYVDGKLIRSVQRSTTRQNNGTYNFPTKLSRVQFGLWDGGQGAQGTAEWAGTPTDWSKPGTRHTNTHHACHTEPARLVG
ncbi:concanavalin A-like lectin/glucanase domain-containing protein, partial [Syncephalis pseudoplumigaleata]